jgi:hypothetical protein
VRARFLFVVVALAAALLPVAPAAAAPNKPFAMNVNPAGVDAGVTVNGYRVTLTNNTGTQQLGSADITIPPALTVLGTPAIDRGSVIRSGNVLQLRGLSLPPTQSATVTLGLRMPCESGPYMWNVRAKQSNDFSGTPGNDLGPLSGTRTTIVSGSCKLRFVAHPQDAEENAQIRAAAFLPDSTNTVAVEAIDGSDAPQRLDWFTGTITLTGNPSGLQGTTSVAAVRGSATFSDLSIAASDNYRLHAATPAGGVTAADSDSFQVVDQAEPCTASCKAQVTGAKSKATLTGLTTLGFAVLTLNLGIDPLTSTGCAGYKAPSASEFYEFRLTATADATVVVEYDKATMKAFKGSASALEACLGVPAPKTFTGKDGLPAAPFDFDGDPANGAEGRAGLLPNCPSTVGNPCVFDRSNTLGGGATITISVPAAIGDPRMH